MMGFDSAARLMVTDVSGQSTEHGGTLASRTSGLLISKVRGMIIHEHNNIYLRNSEKGMHHTHKK